MGKLTFIEVTLKELWLDIQSLVMTTLKQLCFLSLKPLKNMKSLVITNPTSINITLQK